MTETPEESRLIMNFLCLPDPQPFATCILNIALPTCDGCDKFEGWAILTGCCSVWKGSGSTLLLLLHSLPQAAPAGQHLPLQLPKSLTSGSLSCRQSLVLPRLMVRYSWWRQSLGVIFMATNFLHSIFDPSSCTGTQWIVDKVMIEHSLHSVLICDTHTARFPLDCSQAAVSPCTLFRVRCRPHSEGCADHLICRSRNDQAERLAWFA